ncbi:MAG: hypothetical protein HN542_07840 [Flavobacteriales bacterium]|jgi:KDO2-lipid IV(A) lauroyltransferase|nr:hypothetical protein [Flavobacteriales bacterium]NCG28841.1 hypothetical protein [Bacteroidota bacterium]MBT3963062.1 hypothetical protein [Flavobacteriales bacterium]MBT4704328.1 hypothetical protein [Flavobacteriales bacterium]MBT4930516.1 hypothetical protein [Flavobacteriales bacterium]
MTILLLLFWILSKLPTRVLYFISDLIAFVLHTVVKYRRDVVEENLKYAFPEKSELERKAISKEFYVSLSDQILETVKLQSIGADELLYRCQFVNPEVLQKFDDNNENVIVMMGHSGNWEWCGAATELQYDFKVLPVYRRVKNRVINQYFYRLRSRFDSKPILDKVAFQAIGNVKEPHAVALLADQTPSARKGWWLDFLNQRTPFYRGAEVLSNRLKYGVVFAHIRHPKRGAYEIVFEEYKGDASERFALTKAFVEFLEKEIVLHPANWLWSHKRWKHQPNSNNIIID